jgi:hypothetical protein
MEILDGLVNPMDTFLDLCQSLLQTAFQRFWMGVCIRLRTVVRCLITPHLAVYRSVDLVGLRNFPRRFGDSAGFVPVPWSIHP